MKYSFAPKKLNKREQYRKKQLQENALVARELQKGQIKGVKNKTETSTGILLGHLNEPRDKKSFNQSSFKSWSLSNLRNFHKQTFETPDQRELIGAFLTTETKISFKQKQEAKQLDQLQQSIDAVTIVLKSQKDIGNEFSEAWSSLNKDEKSLVSAVNRWLTEQDKANLVDCSKTNSIFKTQKTIPPTSKRVFEKVPGELSNYIRSSHELDGSTEGSIQQPQTSKKQQRQDKKKEKQYFRRQVEKGNTTQIYIQVDIPDSKDYYTLTVNLGRNKTPNTSIYLQKTTDENGTLKTSTIDSGIIDKNFSSKFSFWVWVLFNQNRDNSIKQFVSQHPISSFLTITSNLAAYAWKNDKAILKSILIPDNGIRSNWKNFDITAPIASEEDKYFTIQEKAYVNAKLAYRTSYAYFISEGESPEEAKELALKKAEKEYFSTIVKSDLRLIDEGSIGSDIAKEKAYLQVQNHVMTKRDYKKEYGGRSYRNMKRWNRRKDNRWRRIRDEGFQNTVGPLAIGFTRQFDTGKEVYKICDQKTLPMIQLEELDFIKAEKTFMYNTINHTDTKAYNYAENHKLLQWRWQDLWVLDPFWDGRKLLNWGSDEIIRGVLWSERYFDASSKAIRDTLITLIVIKLVALGFYNTFTPRFIKRIYKKVVRLGAQTYSLGKHLKDGTIITKDKGLAENYLGNHSEIKDVISVAHNNIFFSHGLFEHQQIENRYNDFRANFHRVDPRHVEYELLRDFKGPIAIAAFGGGYVVAIVASICLCFYDIVAWMSPNKKVIKPGAPERWFHHHDPFHDFMQDIRYAFKNIGALSIASVIIKPEIQTVRAEVKGIKQIHDQHLLFPSPSQWLGIYLRSAFKHNTEFRTKVGNFIKTDLELTTLPKNWKKFISQVYFRSKLVKDQVRTANAENSNADDTFYKQANIDVNKQRVYIKEDAIIANHQPFAQQVKDTEFWENQDSFRALKKEVNNSINAPAAQHAAVWENYHILLKDISYYTQHKFQVKHKLTHQMTIWALNHIGNIERFPLKILGFMESTMRSSGGIHALEVDYSVYSSIKAFAGLASSSARVSALVSTTRSLHKTMKWESGHHIDLNYLFNQKSTATSRLTFGFDDYFLHGDSNQEKDRINSRISLNVNITNALIYGFQSTTVKDYYDKNGIYRTAAAFLEADRIFRTNLQQLNAVIGIAAQGISALANVKGEGVLLKRYTRTHPNSLISQISENPENSLKAVKHVLNIDKTLLNVLQPRHLLADIVLSLIVKKVFTSPLSIKDINTAANFCCIKNTKARQQFYSDLTHPLSTGRKHSRLFYETALYWDVLISPRIRSGIATQYQSDAAAHEFQKYWQESQYRAKNGHNSLYSTYTNLMNSKAIINSSLADYLGSNYTQPANANHKKTIHGYNHPHEHLYVYNHRVNLLMGFLRTRIGWYNYVTSGLHFGGGYSILKSLYNGRLQPVGAWLDSKFGTTLSTKFPLTNGQIKTLRSLSNKSGYSIPQILEKIDYINLASKQEIASAIHEFAKTHQADCDAVKNYASNMGYSPSELVARLNKAGSNAEEFIQNVGEAVQDVDIIKHNLDVWCERLSNADQMLKGELNDFCNRLSPGWLRSQFNALGESLEDVWDTIKSSIKDSAEDVDDIVDGVNSVTS